MRSLNKQIAVLEFQNDVLSTSGRAQDGILPGAGDLHLKTMDRMNQGINEIADSVKSLCSKLTIFPGLPPPPPPWAYSPDLGAPPFGSPYPRPPPRSHSISSSSGAWIHWMKPPTVLEAKVQYYNWENFMNRFSDEQATYAIEVLTTGPEFKKEIG